MTFRKDRNRLFLNEKSKTIEQEFTLNAIMLYYSSSLVILLTRISTKNQANLISEFSIENSTNVRAISTCLKQRISVVCC